jgi:hypothetical protein
MLATEFEPVFAKASTEDDLESALQTLLTSGFEVVHRHRAQTYFFAVGNSHDPQWRAMGAQFSLQMTDVIAQIIKGFLPKSTSAAAKRRVDMAARMIHAATFQQIMLEQEELSRLTLSQKVIASELAAMLTGYLVETSAK